MKLKSCILSLGLFFSSFVPVSSVSASKSIPMKQVLEYGCYGLAAVEGGVGIALAARRPVDMSIEGNTFMIKGWSGFALFTGLAVLTGLIGYGIRKN